MSSRLLEILGRAVNVDTADLIWNWLDIVRSRQSSEGTSQSQLLEKIIISLKDNKLEAAEEQLRLYLFENPSCTLGRIAAAAICISHGKIDAAIEELNSVYMRQPGNTMALYALGHCYERKGCEAEASAFYQDCLKFKDYLQLPRERLTAIYLKNGQLEKAIQQFESLKKHSPDDIPILVLLGHLYIATAQYRQAVETFNTAILIHPDNFNFEDNQVEQMILNARFEEAAERLEELLAQEPERADLLIRYGDVLSMLGQDCEATEQYEQAISARPNCLEAAIKLGTHHILTGDSAAAAGQFNMALGINDQVIDAYIGLAIAQKVAENEKEALDTLSLAATIEPNSSFLFAETAVLQFRNGLHKNFAVEQEDSGKLIEGVIKAHRHQIEQQPQNPELYYRLGILMTSIENFDEAVVAFRNAIEINPTFSRARNKLVLSLFQIGQKKAALECIEGPNCLDGDTLNLHYKTALLYCDKLKFASSLMNLENLLSSNLTTSNAAYNIAIVLQNLSLLDPVTSMWENLNDTTNLAMKYI
ncbi:Beta-barrel assembly-enhancing protease [subsurface metagenome]